jgi:hypothetical protein
MQKMEEKNETSVIAALNDNLQKRLLQSFKSRQKNNE